MSKQRDVLTFYYIDEYGNQKEYRTVDITGMTESQINAAKARMAGEMHDYLQSSQYGINSDSISISNDEPMIAKVEEEVQCLESQNMTLLAENVELKIKIELLKEMLVEAYGN
jgi:hypothetical protein